jgi:two-component system, chemotaxis family, protein-glutamate methylesterase/glutaminase
MFRPADYSAFDLVVIASSLGGISALVTVLSSLPGDFPAPIAVAQHVSPTSEGALPRILGRRSRLEIAHAASGVRPERGRVYVAPPDRHVLVTRQGTFMLTQTAKVKFCRPAADPLFVSAAAVHGSRTLGVVLTGANSDGAAGAQAIKWSGGMVLAQDRRSSTSFAMPGAAIATGCVDLVLPLEAIGPAITALAMARGAADFLRVPVQAA